MHIQEFHCAPGLLAPEEVRWHQRSRTMANGFISACHASFGNAQGQPSLLVGQALAIRGGLEATSLREKKISSWACQHGASERPSERRILQLHTVRWCEPPVACDNVVLPKVVAGCLAFESIAIRGAVWRGDGGGLVDEEARAAHGGRNGHILRADDVVAARGIFRLQRRGAVLRGGLQAISAHEASHIRPEVISEEGHGERLDRHFLGISLELPKPLPSGHGKDVRVLQGLQDRVLLVQAISSKLAILLL
mmetsp:Transcript_73541/g.203009  ORF Transcript_73541/g.203009 Transcript_73541/m.203009 type:complete len:251 (+) Transcript_73541:50-802(+)